MRYFFKHPLIVSHPKHLTVDWAQQVANKHSPSIVVKQVNLKSVDIGTTTRIRIKVNHNQPNSLPSHWFVKIPSLNWRARAITALPRLLHTETRFYNELAQHTPTDKPIVLSAKSSFIKGSTLVLNDISEQGAIPGSSCDTLTIEQARQFVDQLSHLHAKFWNKTDNNANYNWLSGPIRKLEDHLGSILAVPLMKRGLNQADDLVTKELHAPAIHYARNRRKSMKFLAQGTKTIIHHDCHPGNLFWKDNKPGLLDWQMVRTGEGISDLAYFMATALAPDTRKAHENELINHYAKSLANNGVENINHEQLLQRYRAHLVYPFEAMLVTLAVGGMMDLEANKTLITRTTAAIKDNNSFSTLSI